MYDLINGKVNDFFGDRIHLISNIYWAVVGKLFNLASSVLVGIFIARYLGPDKYGLMNYVISYVTLFTVISSFGLDNIEIRELSKKKELSRVIIGTALKIRLFLSIITIALICISLIIFNSGLETNLLILIYAFSIIFNSFIVFRNFFTALVLNKLVVKTEIFRSFIGSIIKVFLLILEVDLMWFILALVLDSVLLSSGYIYTYKKYFSSLRKLHYKKKIGRILIKESLPLLLSGVAIIIYQRIDQVIIKNLINTENLGYYSIANQFVEFVLFIPIVISQTMTPILVKSRINDDKLVYEKKRQFFLDMTLWVSILIAIILFISSGVIIRHIYGEQYIIAISTLKILSWKIIFVSFFLSSGQIIIIESIQKLAMVRNLIGCVISITVNLILIPIWGIDGSAIAALFTFLFTGFISHFLIRDYRFFVKYQIKSIIWGWKSFFAFKRSFYE